MSEWLPIETYEPNDSVILWDGVEQWIAKPRMSFSITYSGLVGDSAKTWWHWEGRNPTHWMPLPNPPEGVK